jgi:hypothetical protein
VKPWEIQEAELLARENAYLERYNWFEKIIDNHLFYLLFLAIVCMISFNIGLLIGFLI